MKIGYLLDTHAAPYDGPVPTNRQIQQSLAAFLEEAQICDESGFDSINVPDRHMRTETHFPDPLQFLTALAVTTKRCKLITHALVQTLYHPMHIAEQAAMIDQLSQGRLILTVAMGYHDAYWRMFGSSRAGRRDRFVESVEIIQRAFRNGDSFSYDGKYFQLDNVRLTPQPYQPDGPPIWLGGVVSRSIERAGRMGDAYVADLMPIERDRWRRRVDLYRAAAAQHGKPSRVVLLREAWVADTREEAMKFCSHMVSDHRYLNRHAEPFRHPDFPDDASITPEAWAKHVVVGAPAECAEQIMAYHDNYDVDEICIRLRRATGPSFEATRDNLLRFRDEVIPLVDPDPST